MLKTVVFSQDKVVVYKVKPDLYLLVVGEEEIGSNADERALVAMAELVVDRGARSMKGKIDFAQKMMAISNA